MADLTYTIIKSDEEDHSLSQKELGEIAGVGKSYISEILNRKKRLIHPTD